jgi:diguanylate cyclase (GGDEF)-like protein
VDGLSALLFLLPVAGALPVAALWWRARRRAATERAARDLLLEAIEATPCQFALFDAQRHLVHANAAYRRLHIGTFGRPGPILFDDLMRGLCAQTLPPDQVEAEVARRVARHETEAEQRFDRHYADGRWLRVTKRRLPSGAVAAFALDITPLKSREAELEASEAQFRAMVDGAPVGIWHLAADGSTRFGNGVLSAILGGLPAGIAEAGLRLPDLGDPKHPFGFPPGARVEVPLSRRGEPVRMLLVVASPWIADPAGGRSALLTFADISNLKSAEAQVEHMARHDPLTGLANRDGFRAALAAMIAEGGGALVLLDLDNFKEANERHGHEAGDMLLVAIAERLRNAMRPDDTVCRLGGDEFALVVGGVDADAAMTVAARATRLAAQPVAFGGLSLRITASAGVALAPLHEEAPDAVLRAADLALHESKVARRGEPELFRPALREQSDQQLRLRAALAPALAAGEFRLVFQPQRDLATRALLGAESLIRWKSSALGREVGPTELLGAAAETRLLPEVDEWVVAEAIARLAEWAGEPNAPPVLAINISTVSLRDPGLADRVARRLLAAGVEPERLEIEVPESIAVRDIEAVRPTLERLNSVGVRLALDDFGAGLSSLQHVVSLPVDRLKLDRSITVHLDGPEPPRAVLRATLALARSMGIEVMAEGVETEAQAFALRREGVTLAQGWLVGQPVDSAHLFEWRRQPGERRATQT